MARLTYVDLAKAIAIILVVVGHYFPDNAPSCYIALRSWIYTFHMPLFMFLSGFIYISFKKEESYISFVAKKAKRLVIPYFAISVIIISIKLLSQRGLLVENPVSPTSYLHIFYYPAAGYFLWFLWALFTYFLIIPFFRTVKARLILLLMSFLLHYVFTLHSIELFAINESSRNLIWFVLGTVFYDYVNTPFAQRTNNSYRNIQKTLVVLLFSIASILFFFKIPYIQNTLPWLGIAAITALTSWLANFKTNPCVRTLSLIGTSCFTIYLFHTTFEGFAKSLLHKVSFGSDISFTFSAIFCILIGVTIPIFLHFFFQKFKVTRILFGLK